MADELPSKSQRKRQMHELQDLGVALGLSLMVSTHY